jgi:hypothetical protein
MGYQRDAGNGRGLNAKSQSGMEPRKGRLKPLIGDNWR